MNGNANPQYHSIRKENESPLHHALREILLIESGRTIRHNMADAEMWQAMTDIARGALEADRREELEAQRLARKHVTTGNRLEFTYRPTPPSGPPPKESEES